MIECLTHTDDDGRVIIEVHDDYSGQYRRTSFDLDLVTAEKHMQSLIDHINYVRIAGEKIGVPRDQLAIHDNSKWSHGEFPQYARNFHGDKLTVDNAQVTSDFALAWLHHIHHNPHHWQYWIFPDGYSPKGSDVESGIVQMPDHYALEMIADWMGASMAYTGSWDLTDWLHKNMPKIKLHSKTAVYLRNVLDSQGYADVVWAQRFGHERADE